LASPPEPKVPIFPQLGLSRPQWSRRLSNTRTTLRNAKALAAALLAEGVTLITGGTDNHLIVIDTVASFGLDGRDAEAALDAVGITTNK